MNIIAFLRELSGTEDKQYKDLIKSIKAGLKDETLDFRTVDFVANARQYPHWKLFLAGNPHTFPDHDTRLSLLFAYVKNGYHPGRKLAAAIEEARKYWNSPKGQAQEIAKQQAERTAEEKLHPPKPAVRLQKTINRYWSKFGGEPNLPLTLEWPLNPENTELDFIAQIHFPELPSGLGLPETGTLFVFYDEEKQPWGMEDHDAAYWKLLYSADELPDKSRKRRTRHEDYKHRETFLKYEIFESHVTADSELTGQHQMLGYPIWIQDKNMSDPNNILLLQIDTDEDNNGPNFLWGDSGRLFFWIAPEDLAEHRFERTKLILECY